MVKSRNIGETGRVKRARPKTKRAIKQTIERFQIVARDHPWIFVRATWPDLLCYAQQSGPHKEVEAENLPNHGQKGWQAIVKALEPTYQSSLRAADLDKWWG